MRLDSHHLDQCLPLTPSSIPCESRSATSASRQLSRYGNVSYIYTLDQYNENDFHGDNVPYHFFIASKYVYKLVRMQAHLEGAPGHDSVIIPNPHDGRGQFPQCHRGICMPSLASDAALTHTGFLKLGLPHGPLVPCTWQGSVEPSKCFCSIRRSSAGSATWG